MVDLGRKPVRVKLSAIDREDRDDLPRSIEVLCNPTQLTYSTKAEWAAIDVPGLSHNVLQYSHTASSDFSLELWWSAIEVGNRLRQARRAIVGDVLPPDDIMFKHRDFLQAFMYPIDRGQAPSRMQINWPGTLNIVAIVKEVKFTFSEFAHNGSPTLWTAMLDCTEIRRSFKSTSTKAKFFDDVDLETDAVKVNR